MKKQFDCRERSISSSVCRALIIGPPRIEQDLSKKNSISCIEVRDYEYLNPQENNFGLHWLKFKRGQESTWYNLSWSLNRIL